MMEETATVIAINNAEITVESEIKSTCSTCHQVDTCGSGQVAKAMPHRKLTSILTTSLQLKIGDKVMLGIPEKHILQTAWQVYMWPLIGLILFASIGQWLLTENYIEHELLSVIISTFGGYIGYRLARYFQKNNVNSKWLTPQILHVISTVSKPAT